MPTTHATSLAFCQQAGGDTATAAVSSTFGSLVGSAVAPLVAAWLLGGSGGAGKSNMLSTLSKLAAEVLLPFAGGLAAQLLLGMVSKHSSRAALHVQQVKMLAGLLSNLLLVVLIFLIFAHTLDKHDLSQYGVVELTKLLAYVLFVHITVVAGAWVCSKPLSPRRRVAFVLTAPQKTETLALAILAILTQGSPYPEGLLALPVIVYHTLQMLVGALGVPWLRWWLSVALDPAVSQPDGACCVRRPPPPPSQRGGGGWTPLREALLGSTTSAGVGVQRQSSAIVSEPCGGPGAVPTEH